jgi:hypothetical protein
MKQFDRYGWDRDRGTAAHDRLVINWMNALQDYPIDELQAACSACIIAKPDKLPNYGHVKAQILVARRDALARQPKPVEPMLERVAPDDAQKARADAIMAGFNKGKSFAV